MTQDRKTKYKAAVVRIGWNSLRSAAASVGIGIALMVIYNEALVGLFSDKPLSLLQAVAIAMACDLLVGRAYGPLGPPTN